MLGSRPGSCHGADLRRGRRPDPGPLLPREETDPHWLRALQAGGGSVSSRSNRQCWQGWGWTPCFSGAASSRKDCSKDGRPARWWRCCSEVWEHCLREKKQLLSPATRIIWGVSGSLLSFFPQSSFICLLLKQMYSLCTLYVCSTHSLTP